MIEAGPPRTPSAVEWSVLSTYLRDLNDAVDLESAQVAILRAALEVTAALGAEILMIGENSKKVMPAARRGSVTRNSKISSWDLDPNWLSHFNQRRPLLLVRDTLGQFCMPLCESFFPRQRDYAIYPIFVADLLVAFLVLEFDNATQVADNEALDSLLKPAGIAIEKAIALESRGGANGKVALAVGEDLNEALDIGATLGQLIERGKQIADATIGGVWLHDAKSDTLVLHESAFGHDTELTRRRSFSASGSGAIARVFRTGVCYLRGDGHDGLVEAAHQELSNHYRNCVAIPLGDDQRRFGVLVLADKRSGEFAVGDLQGISTSVSDLAVAIGRRLEFWHHRRAVSELSGLSQIVDTQRQELERTSVIHDEFTQMVLEGRGLQAIISTLSKLVADPVAVEDRFFNLLGYYPMDSPADHQYWQRYMIANELYKEAIRRDPEPTAVVASLVRRRRPARLLPSAKLGFDQSRVVAPILVGRECMGQIYVFESNRSLDRVDIMAVERAATAIALQMMNEKVAIEAQYKMRGDMVHELLAGSYGSVEMLLRRAAYLGIDLSIPRAVLVFDIDDFEGFAREASNEDEVVAIKARVLAVLQRACSRSMPDALLTARSDEVIVLASIRSEVDTQASPQTVKIAASLRGEVSRWLQGPTLSVGIGSICNSLADYPRSLQEARSALNVIRALHQRDRILAFDQLGIFGLLFDPCNRDRLVCFVKDVVGKLLEYDRRHATRLTESIHQYLLHDRDVDLAAQVLCVHPNTLRYRMQRAGEILKTDLNSSEAISNLHLALKAVYGLRLA